MKRACLIITTLLLCSVSALHAQTYLTFDPRVRYSRVVIDANLYHFKANTKDAGFAKYDESGTLLAESESSRGFDYVPGLVAKGVLEAVALYQDSAWAKPWFYSIQAYGDKYAGEARTGGSLDDLNACKMYFGLADLTSTNAKFADATRYASYLQAQKNALSGLEQHNSQFAISSETSQAFCGTDEFAGGWWHKSNYPNQMWLDGQYMGPALLAELLHRGYTFNNLSSSQAWDFVAQQFIMSWHKLWDADKQLLWHAFTATPSTDQTQGWADQDNTSNHYGVSQEYWGRAEGWYFLALVDVLERMPDNCVFRDTLRNYLNEIAIGLVNCQQTEGVWCQLLAYDKGVVPSGCKTANYLEASASAIFTAAFLKGIRLGLFDLDFSAVAKMAYQGLIRNFLTTDCLLVPSCASAGLSSNRNGTAAYYLADVGEKDTKKVITYMEGKPFGAFILAAVEYEKLYYEQEAKNYKPTDDNASISSCKCLTVVMK